MSEYRDWGDTEFRQALREVLPLYPKLIRFLWGVSRFHLSVSLALTSITALIPPGIIWATKFVVDAADQGFKNQLPWTMALVPLAAIFALWIAQSVLQSLHGVVSNIYGTLVDIKSRGILLEKAALLDLAFFESPRFYDKLHHANRERWALTSVHESLVSVGSQLLTMTSLFALLATLHPLAIVVLAVTMLPNIAIDIYYIKHWYRLESDTVRDLRLANYMSELAESREAAKEVRVFSLKNFLVNSFKSNIGVYFLRHRKIAINENILFTGANAMGFVGIALIWLYAVYEAVNGRLSLGAFTMITLAAESCRSMLLGFVETFIYALSDALTLTWYFQFIELEPKSVTGSLERRKTTTRLSRQEPAKRIEFQHVSFRYPGTEPLILDDVSFEIEPNRKLAVVGENGAGKTTLIKLLTRLYDPVDGSILLDDRDLRDYDLEELRSSMRVVFQDFAKFDVSAYDNIAWGDVTRKDDRNAVEQAAQSGGAHEAILELPSGYETILGRTFDEGVDLSGGEWQNIAIARAFFADTPMLILDEPTAALDALNEQALYDRMNELGLNKTVVFISHRFSTVRMADNIVVIDKGQLIENGPHEDLMKIDGKYRQMFSRQASRYTRGQS